MYILINKSGFMIGLFTSRNTLNAAIEVCRKNSPNEDLYYKYTQVDNFNPDLVDFHTMHTEHLNKIEIGINHV